MPISRDVIYATLLKVMGCGHSKTGAKGKKDRKKKNVRQEEIPQKDSDDDDSVDSDVEEVHERANEMKSLTGRTNEIPLTLAQKKLSCSQQNFFKMLDEKIESGRDYDDYEEKAAENARLASLLKDWETASAGSRSLEGTPKKSTFQIPNGKLPTAAAAAVVKAPPFEKKPLYPRQNTTPIPQSVIHQSYGVAPMATTSLAYRGYPDTYPQPPFATPLCVTQLANENNQRLCSIRSAANSVVAYENNNCRLYTQSANPRKGFGVNGGDLIIQQQIQLEQAQYRQAKEMAQFRLLKEQQLVQQQQMQHQHNQAMMRNYHSSIHIPMAVAQSYKEALNQKNQIER